MPELEKSSCQYRLAAATGEVATSFIRCYECSEILGLVSIMVYYTCP